MKKLVIPVIKSKLFSTQLLQPLKKVNLNRIELIANSLNLISKEKYEHYEKKSFELAKKTFLIEMNKKELVIRKMEELLNNNEYSLCKNLCDSVIDISNDQKDLLKAILVKAYTYKGMCLSKGTREEEDQALECFDKALELEPDYDMAKHGKRDILIERCEVLPEELKLCNIASSKTS
jgi:lipoprotein NlpI